MKLIEILPNVYGVKVPMESYNFNFGGKTLFYELSPIEDIPYVELSIPFGFKILGTLTKDEISFDASEVVEYKTSGKVLGNIKLYWNYKTEKWCFDDEKSFRSALPDEIYFENEYGKNKPELELECCCSPADDGNGKPICCGVTKPSEDSIQLQDLWQSAQENITQKLLILQKL